MKPTDIWLQQTELPLLLCSHMDVNDKQQPLLVPRAARAHCHTMTLPDIFLNAPTPCQLKCKQYKITSVHRQDGPVRAVREQDPNHNSHSAIVVGRCSQDLRSLVAAGRAAKLSRGERVLVAGDVTKIAFSRGLLIAQV